MEKLSYYSPMLSKKPYRSATELIEKMENKGITFKSTSKEEAANYLVEKNNFLRLYAYRKNFQKAQLGEKAGQYVNLDFDHLKALSILDLQLRKQIFGMCIDIEHCLKLFILKDIETKDPEDSYAIVSAFLKSNKHTAKEILRKNSQKNSYISDLLKKYISNQADENVFCIEESGVCYYMDMPIWVLLESITFGSLIQFYEFYCQYYEKSKSEYFVKPKLLSSIKSIRNACAHNNCILHNLSESQCNPHSFVQTFVIRKKGVKTTMAHSRLTCRTLHEFASVIYLANKPLGASTFLPSDILRHDIKEIQAILINFESKYLNLFQKNDLILSSFRFLKKIVDMEE